MSGAFDSGYALAQAALLKALDALEPLGLEKFVLVGAQAVYIRAEIIVPQMPPFTSDADLVVNPSLLPHARSIYDSLGNAGLKPRGAADGLYGAPATDGSSDTLEVDIFVPEGYRHEWSGDTYNAIDARATMAQEGLELTLTDHSPIAIALFDPLPKKNRTFELNVAGVVSLVIAKAWKIGERHGQGESEFRKVVKDVGDIYRLLISSSQDDWEAATRKLPRTPAIQNVTKMGTAYLGSLCGRGGPGIELLRTAIGASQEAEIILESLPHLVDEFCATMKANV